MNYHLRVFTDIMSKCVAQFEAPFVPHIGEAFYLEKDDCCYRINDIMYSDLDNLQIVDIIANIDNSYDHLYEEEAEEF